MHKPGTENLTRDYVFRAKTQAKHNRDIICDEAKQNPNHRKLSQISSTWQGATLSVPRADYPAFVSKGGKILGQYLG